MSNSRRGTRDGATADHPESLADLIGRIKPIERSLQVCLRGDLWARFDQAEYELAMHRRFDLKPAQTTVDLLAESGRLAIGEDPPVEGAISTGDQSTGGDAWTALQAAKQEEARLERAVLAIIDEAREHTITVRVRAFPGGRVPYTKLVEQHETGDILYLRDDRGGFITDETGEKLPRLNKQGEPDREVDLTTFRPALMARACLYPKFADAAEAQLFIDALDSPTTVDSICNAITNATQQGLSVPFSTLVSTTPTRGSEQS